MLHKAEAIARRYIEAHLDRSNPGAEYTMFVVWQVNVLQNYKCLIATTAPYGMYLELTYDGDRSCWYLDAYHKMENLEISDGVHEQSNP